MSDHTPFDATDEGSGASSPDVEALLRDLTAEDLALESPPPGLWADIAAAAGVAPSDPATATAADEVATPESTTNVASLAERRLLKATPARILAAAAAVMLVAMGVFAVTRSDTDDTPVIASASLSHDATFDPAGAAATAAVSLRGEEETLVLRFDEATLPDVGGEQADLELWLIRPDADGGVADLVSLGVIDPERPGAIAIPASVDPNEFFVVDISIEPRDGDETHSGRSILRGPLDA